MTTFLFRSLSLAASLYLIPQSLLAQLPPPPGTGLLPPVCDAGENLMVDAAGEFTSVDLAVLASDPDGNDSFLTYLWSVPTDSTAIFTSPVNAATATGLFPVGDTVVTVEVTDQAMVSSTCTVLVSVQRVVSPPVLVCEVDPEIMWPPNRKMREVVVTAQVSSDAVDSLSQLVGSCFVVSDEPDSGEGDSSPGRSNSHSGDVNGEDGFSSSVPVEFTYDDDSGLFVASLRLRAERLGSGDGRSYTITCSVEDPLGQTAEATCVVFVPHDRRDGIPVAVKEAKERQEARKSRKAKKRKKRMARKKKLRKKMKLARLHADS